MDLFTLWLLIWVLKNAVMDVSCAVKGTPNPRYELKKAKARAAGLNPPAQPRYGTRDWFNDLLADGLQAQTEWRRRKADAKRQARELAEAEEAELVDEAEAVDGPAGRPVGDPVDKPVARPAGDEQEPVAPAGVVHSNSSYITQEGAGKWAWTCRDPGCPGKGFDYDTQEEAQEGARQHRCEQAARGEQTSGSADGEAAGPEQQQSPRPTEAPGDQPWAKVIPFRTTNQQEENVSTDINTEVIGLDQSIAYAHNLATFAGEHGQAGNEGYIAHLTGAKVEGEGLNTAASMQEAFSNAEAAAEAHAVELERQKAVQEAYDANPDAGDKAFQTEGR